MTLTTYGSAGHGDLTEATQWPAANDDIWHGGHTIGSSWWDVIVSHIVAYAELCVTLISDSLNSDEACICDYDDFIINIMTTSPTLVNRHPEGNHVVFNVFSHIM